MSLKEDKEYSKLQSRKFWIFLILSLLATVFLLQEIATFAEWADLMKWSYITYSGANVASKFGPSLVDKVKGVLTKKEIDDEQSAV